MEIQTPFIGPELPSEFGNHVSAEQQLHGINQRSFPFSVTNIPTDAAVLAGTLMDYDTIPFVGFAWLHWVFTDLAVTGTTCSLAADESRTASFPQGLNSLHSPFQRLRQPTWEFLSERTNLETHYAGPRPRSGVHHYRLTIYALANPTHLQDGFTQADLMNQLDGNLLASAGRNFTYTK